MYTFYLCICMLILYVVIFIMHSTRPKTLLNHSMQCFLHYCSVLLLFKIVHHEIAVTQLSMIIQGHKFKLT